MRTPARSRPTSLFRFSPLAAALACALGSPAALSSTTPVTNNLDDMNSGSLRYAIDWVNNEICGGSQVIKFLGGPFVINVAGSVPLPPVTCPNVTIQGDGSTINGADLVPNSLACGLMGDSSTPLTVDKLELTGFRNAPMDAALCGWVDATNMVVHDSIVGVHLDYGSTLKSSTISNNTGKGVWDDGGSTIGGLGEGNIIHGNGGAGIYLAYGGSALNNRVGVTASGLRSANNVGIWSHGNAFIDGNLVSGNATSGIRVEGPDFAMVTNNTVGLNATGDGPMGNATGIEATCVSNLNISGNHLSGNNNEGLFLGAVNASSVNSNWIGFASNNSSPVGNTGNGVVMTSFAACEGLGTFDVNFHGNHVAHNTANGVHLDGSSAGNNLSSNSIFANSDKNIDLDYSDGARPNDNLDGDGGPNHGQNRPVINSVIQTTGGQTDINWSLNSRPNAVFSIEFYTNTAAGVAAGETLLGATTYDVTTNSGGNASGTKTYSGAYTNITALAISKFTDAATSTYRAGDTSEFSDSVAAVVAPSASITPTTVNFNDVATGGSATQAINILSNGGQDYVIQAITAGPSPTCYGGPICASGDFMCSTNCTTFTNYAPGASCSITTSFAPNVIGPQSTKFYICDNTGVGPRTITLNGNGIVPPVLQVLPSTFDFGSVLVGQASPPQVFKFANPGTSEVPIGPVTTGGEFDIVSNTCGASIAPNNFCLAEVVFAPTQPGSLSGFVALTTGGTTLPPLGDVKNAAKAASGSTVSASLSGNGAQAAALVLPKSVDLGSYTLGSPNPLVKIVELTNSGNAVLTFTSITVTGPFTIDNPCPLNLQPGVSCQVRVMFTATERGEFTGGLSVVTNAQGGSGLIALTARAQPVALPLIRIAPTFMGFGDRVVGSVATSQRLTVTNEGGAVAALSPLTVSVDFLVLGTTCGLTLEPSSSCFADVAFRPVGFGVRSGQLLVNSNAVSSPNVLSLIGTGCRPFVASGSRLGTRSNCSP